MIGGRCRVVVPLENDGGFVEVRDDDDNEEERCECNTDKENERRGRSY